MNSEVPDTYIANQDKALVLAYASKDERCLQAAGYVIDAVLDPYTSGAEMRSLTQDAAVAEALFEVSKTYPEAFTTIKASKNELSEKDLLDQLSSIVQCGGLPRRETNSSTFRFRRRTAEELHETALLREQIAEALFDTTPSKDFVKDYGLQKLGYAHENPVDIVVGLLDTAKYYEALAARHKLKAQQSFEQYKDDELRSTPKLNAIMNMLNTTFLELDRFDRGKFRQDVDATYDSYETTLASLEDLWLEGQSKIITEVLKRAAAAQVPFDMILSGEAQYYVTPATEPVSTS